MRRICCRRSLLAAGLGLLVAAPPTLGQTPAPPPPAGPAPPDLVLSGRDVRVTRAGYAHVVVGCRQTSTPGDVCTGTLVLKLHNPLTVTLPGGSHTRRISVTRKLGTATFSIPTGVAERLTLRLYPLFTRGVRQQGSVIVQLIGGFVDREGQGGTVKRFVSFYFPTRPPI
jgi:hypothetical protein